MNIELEYLHRYYHACKIAHGKVVLDIACGEGYGSAMLATKADKVIGVDISADVVKHARSRYKKRNLEYMVGSCTDIPLPDASIDMVVSFETIEHHDQHERMMKEVKRVMRPTGVLIISSPEKYNYSVEPGYNNSYHIKDLYEHELKQLLGVSFKYTAYYRQRVLYGSGIFSEAVPKLVLSYLQENGAVSKSQGLTRPMYWIALASDDQPPLLASGVFEQPVHESEIVKSFCMIVVEREEQVPLLQKSIYQRDDKISDLTHCVVARGKETDKPNQQLISEHQDLLAKHHLALAARDGTIEKLTHDIVERDETILWLKHTREKREAYINELIGSTSWYLTKPLRWVSRVARGDFVAALAPFKRHLTERKRVTANIHSEKELGHKFKIYDECNPDVLIGCPASIEDHFNIRIPANNHISGATPESLARVGFFVHVFYPELLDELLVMLKPLGANIRLFFTTDSESKSAQILDSTKRHGLVAVSVKVAPNRGRDIAPRLIFMQEEINSVEYAVFLHTKKSHHIEGGNDWRQYLWHQLIGTQHIVLNILSVFEHNPYIGLLAPHHWNKLAQYQAINWGYNYMAAKNLISRLGGDISADTPLDFPSGSMFWFRTKVFSDLFKLNLTIEDFEPETGQVDGTKAHAIERSFFYIAECARFDWLKYSVDTNKNSQYVTNDFSKSTIRLLSNERSDNLLTNSSPESAPIPYRPHHSNITRLNLLLPTLRKLHVFGGIKTAVTLFSSTANLLTLDSNLKIRIIVTDDTYLNSQDFLCFSDFSFTDVSEDSFEVKSVCVRPHLLKDAMELSPNDIYFASAWWNALECQRLQKIQKFLFGQCQKFVYFIQDYEPGFYAWSSKSALADSTYNASLPAIHIVNDSFLYDELKARLSENHFILPFGLNDAIYENLINSDPVKRENIILFYGRPSVSRNLFELTVDSIGKWIINNPFESRKWRVISVGEAYSEEFLPDYLRNHIQILGKLEIKEYAYLLKCAKVGISFMQSPHPSYPPQEMAAAGLVVITNNWNSKNWSTRPGKYIPVDNLSPLNIAKCIDVAIGTPTSDFSAESIQNICTQTKVNNETAQSIAHLLYVSRTQD